MADRWEGQIPEDVCDCKLIRALHVYIKLANI